MHSHLIFFVASFATSIVAAPIPASTNNAVEAASPLMVREANAGVISPELDIIKREILERLDAIIERRARGIDPVEKREPARSRDKLHDANDKREPGHLDDMVAANDKREPGHLDDMVAANDKREPGHLDDIVAANDKREPGHLDGIVAANGK